MPTLSAAELADLRSVQADTLPDTCTIQTATFTNTKGSVAAGYANTYTAVACRLAGGAGGEQELGLASASEVTHILTVGHGQAVGPTDRVVHDSVTYEVVAVENDKASWRTAKRVYLKRVM